MLHMMTKVSNPWCQHGTGGYHLEHHQSGFMSLIILIILIIMSCLDTAYEAKRVKYI